MRITLVVLFNLLSTCVVFAQQNEPDSSAGIRDLVRVTFLNPGIGYEKRIGRFQSLVAEVYGGLGFDAAQNNLAYAARYDVYIEPGASLQYRYYYNYKARSMAGRRTENNNLNFVGPLYQFAWTRSRNLDLDSYDDYALHNIGFVWGLQRNYPKRFSLALSLGVGYMFTKEAVYRYSPNPPFTATRTTQSVSEYTFLGQFSLGFWLGKRK